MQIADLCRIVLAVVFIFSGFIKTIDPWGTAIKFQEYFEVFGMEWLSGWSVGLAIWMCAAELMMGCMLMFKVRLRLISIFALLTMTGFTILTFVIAVWNPLDGCGCLGEAIKLDNWHSFFKNLVLWPMSILLWYTNRGKKILNFSRREIVLTLVFATLAGSLGVYSWRQLPLIDMYPYKVGVNLRTDVLCSRCADRNMTLVFNDRETGEQREFAVADTTWYDEGRWEYVRTVDPYEAAPASITNYDFALWRDGLNRADDVVYRDGDIHMIIIRGVGEKLPSGCEKKLIPYVEKLHGEGAYVICLGGVVNNENYPPADIEIGGVTLPCYGVDRGLLQLMLRADVGEVVVRDGVIASKKSCWNLK